MRVAINGTGVAGPTLAYWLRRFGHEPFLFEKAPELRTGGYVIDFWGLGFEIADRMGLVPTLLDRGYKMKRLSIVDALGHEVAGMDVTSLRTRSTAASSASHARTSPGPCSKPAPEFQLASVSR